MTGTPKHPDPFLEVRIERLDLSPPLLGWCAGYELQEWRATQLSKHLLHWLPEFALKYSEWQDLGAHNAVQLVGKAAKSIYKSKKYDKRGEFGEILLHLMIRQHFKSVPAISKFFYKDNRNDTVKGFDAVHVVQQGNSWELWLGEVKFYDKISAAISDVVKELKEHTDRDYLRDEFTAITNKLDDSWGEAARLRTLLHSNQSLDQIFKSVCIPVLLTYDSKTIQSFKEVSDEYKREFEKEVLRYRDTFASKALPTNVAIRLFLFPLKKKSELVEEMDEALKQCQATF
ncbi:MAG: DUF1837 domain-containing protein [Candidatus Obscuribacterales bacterium]|nr:DUF1837 domain-containing protein [Candidatus Obscuribacterales bacterium]